MMSKAVAFVCLLFVSTVVIASAVSEGTQEQHETVEVENGNLVEESKQQRCRYGCCRYVNHRCVRCCPRPAEVQATTQNQNVENENPVEESKQGCRYRCCRFDPITRRCIRCCPRPAEVQATTQNQNVENRNPVEESKQRCRYGCCRYDPYRRCIRCCPRPAEAQATTQNHNENEENEENEVETNTLVGSRN